MAEEAIVSDLLEVFRQHMLQEAVHEGKSRQGFHVPLFGFRVLASKGNLVVFDSNNAVVGESHPKDIASKVDDRLLATADRLTVYNPFFLPDCRWRQVEQSGLFESIAEFGSEDSRNQFHPDEEILFGGQPLTMIATEAAAGNQEMNVGMIACCFVPGMHDTGHADFTADKAWIESQFLKSCGRRLKEDIVNDPLFCVSEAS